MNRHESMLRIAANSDISVLLLGESGSGKEVAARFIHEHSQRAGGPFVALNCGAIARGLAESILEGHRKGAFTGPYILPRSATRTVISPTVRSES